MKKYFIAVVAMLLYSTSYAETMESSVKDTSVHEETIVTQDGDETYTTTIYRSTDYANQQQSDGTNWNESTSDNAYYKEVVTGTDGYSSMFEERYGADSTIAVTPDSYDSHVDLKYMHQEAEFNPNTMRDTAMFESSRYIQDIHQGGGVYQEDIYGEAIWKSYVTDFSTGYHEQIYGESVWDSDVSISADYWQSHVYLHNIYEQSITDDEFSSDYFTSSHYIQDIQDGAEWYLEDIYGEAVVKTRMSQPGYSQTIYGEAIFDSDHQISLTSYNEHVYESDTYMQTITADGFESSMSNVDTHESYNSTSM